MLGWLASLIGGRESKKVVDTVADGISSGVDKLILTDEEKLDYNAKAAELYLKFVELQGSENSLRSQARRGLANAIIFSNLLAFWVCVGHILIGKPLVAKEVIALAMAFNLGWAFLAVIGFYFGVHLLRGYNETKKKGTTG